MLFVVYVMYLLFWPFKVIDIENADNIQVGKKVYVAGEQISYTIKYCKYLDVAATSHPYLQNSTLVFFTPYTSNQPPQCKTATITNYTIPLGTAPGKYRIGNDFEYKVNPLRTMYYRWKSEEFEVK